MNRRHFLALTGGLAAQTATLLRVPSAEAAAAAAKSRLDRIAETKARILPLHSKKGPVRPGDWLDEHKEDGQSFAQFLTTHKTPAQKQYPTLYVQPLGTFTKSQRAIVDHTVDFMSRFYGMPTKVLPDVSLAKLPAKARRVHPTWDVPQVLSTHLLYEVLKPLRPTDAAAVLGLTAEDLWPGKNWNYVFGQASLSERVGVWSIYRNGDVDGTPEEQKLFLQRTLGTATHETGHMFGIQHCIAYECGMNGSNSQEEGDRQPLEFCPECQAKLWWTCNLDWSVRFQKLEEFAQAHDLQEEAEFWKKSRAAIAK